MAPSKEEFLERKFLCLEQRVTRVERLLETRFSEFLEDYSTRVAPEHPPPPPEAKPTPSFSVGSQSGAAPASVKRKRQDGDLAPHSRPQLALRTFKKESGGGGPVIKDCSVHVERLTLTPLSSPGGITSRTRRIRIPVVREDFVTSIKTRTRSDRREDDDENDNDRNPAVPAPTPVLNENKDCAYLDGYNDSGSGPPSPVAAEGDDDVELGEDSYFRDDSQNPTVYQDEGEEEESYFTYPATLRPSRTGRRSATSASISYNDEGEDEFQEIDKEGGEGDPADQDWSGGDEDDDDIDKPKKKRKRKYIRIGDIPKDVIKANDPNMKQCPVCRKHFKGDIDTFNAHVNTHSKARNLTCPFPNCGKTYYSLVTLLRHKSLHNPEKYGRKCRLCSRFFSRTDKALVHERLCAKNAVERGEEVNPLIIEDLQRRTRGKWRWVAPTPKKKEAEEKKNCPICNWRMTASSLETHLKNHENGRNWTCNLCDKTFFNKNSLIRHISNLHSKQNSSKARNSEVDQVEETASAEGAEEEEDTSPSEGLQFHIKHEVHEVLDINNEDDDD